MPDEVNGQPVDSSPAPDASAPPASDTFAGVTDFYRSRGEEIPEGMTGEQIFNYVHSKAFAPPDPQLQHLAARGRQYADFENSKEYKEYQAWYEANKKQQPAPAAPKKKGFQWEVPKWKKDWETHAIRDPETGRWVPHPQNAYFSPQAVSEANAYQSASAEHSRRIIEDFPNLVNESQADTWRKFKEEEFGKMMEDYLLRRETAQRAKSYIDEHDRELFQYDEQGQKVMDPATGKPALNDHGRLMQYHIDKALTRLQQITGPLESLSDEQWALVQNWALEDTPADVTAAKAWRDHFASLQPPPAAAPAPQAQPATPPPPNAKERNEIQKNNKIASKKAQIRDMPGDVAQTRNVSRAAKGLGKVPDLGERFKEHFSVS